MRLTARAPCPTEVSRRSTIGVSAVVDGAAAAGSAYRLAETAARTLPRAARRVVTIDAKFGRAAASMAALLDRVRTADRDGATIEELLWLVWERSRLADPWFKEATSAGVTAAEVWTSLSLLTLVYGALAVVELWLITRFVRRGVTTADGAPTPGTPAEGTPESREDDDVLQFAY